MRSTYAAAKWWVAEQGAWCTLTRMVTLECHPHCLNSMSGICDFCRQAALPVMLRQNLAYACLLSAKISLRAIAHGRPPMTSLPHAMWISPENVPLRDYHHRKCGATIHGLAESDLRGTGQSAGEIRDCYAHFLSRPPHSPVKEPQWAQLCLCRAISPPLWLSKNCCGWLRCVCERLPPGFCR